jgi:RNA polymerase sigma-70 factor (ECF subfamily)
VVTSLRHAALTLPATPVSTADSTAANARIATIVEEHYDVVWRSLRRFGVADAEADDAAQQVFCVLARRISDVPEEKVKTFLFGVVLRIAQASRRQRARRAEVSDDDAIAAVPTTAPGADEQLDDARARAVLDALLDQLPIELRTVFVLYEIEEMTMAEIAAILELPPGTVASRLRRARGTFAELARGASR